MNNEMKKIDGSAQLNDEELDQVAGGYSRATWKSMSTEERIRAKEMSDAYRTLGQYCAMDDPNA